MNSVRAAVWLAPLLLVLSGCHLLHGNSCRGTQAYMDAKSVAPLKIPAGLDTPETANALHIPTLNEPAAPPRKDKEPCLDEPPSFKVRKPAPAPQA